jgi:hypothetical protein
LYEEPTNVSKVEGPFFEQIQQMLHA